MQVQQEPNKESVGNMNKSWKTTSGGVATIIVALGGAVKMLTDGDAVTNPDWNAVIAAVVAGATLVFARDNNVTSENAGAK